MYEGTNRKQNYMTYLNYFDLGLHKDAKELDIVLNICDAHNVRCNIYGVEAHSQYCSKLADKYKDFDNVAIINKAISDKNEKIKLYISPLSGQGNSIFRSKRNVTDDYILVDGVCFSDLLSSVRPTFREEVNVLKFNIEGAEWHLINDLDNNELFKYFIGIFGTNDISKVKEIKHNLREYKNILNRNRVTITSYSSKKSSFYNSFLKLILSECT